MAAAKEMCVRNVSEEPRRDYKQTRKHMRWIRDKSQTGDASMATPLWLTDQSSRWHENLLVSRWRLRDVAQQAEGQPPANAEVVGLVRGSIFSRASNIISASRRSPLARQITHLRISAKRNGKRKKGESLSSLSLSFWWFHPVLARVVSRNSFKSCLCICSRESSGFPLLEWRLQTITASLVWKLSGVIAVRSSATLCAEQRRQSAFVAAGVEKSRWAKWRNDVKPLF